MGHTDDENDWEWKKFNFFDLIQGRTTLSRFGEAWVGPQTKMAHEQRARGQMERHLSLNNFMSLAKISSC